MLATMSSKVLILAAVLAAGSLAAADDLTPLQLAIPDAPIVIGMNFDHIRLAYAGSRYQELLTPENRAQYEQRWKSMKDMLGFDLSQLQEAVISVRPGPAPKSAQGLLILRGPFDPDHPPVVLMFLGVQRTMFEGVPLLVTKPGKGDPVAIAFLGRTLALAGDPPSVRAAISRWKAGSASHSPLLAKAEEMNRTFHVWCLARDLQSAMPHDAALPKGTDAIERAFQSIEEITVGMTLAPGFRASVDLVAHAAKDAAALQGAVSVAMAIAMAQSAPQKAKDFLKGVEITSKERTVRGEDDRGLQGADETRVTLVEGHSAGAPRRRNGELRGGSAGTPKHRSGGAGGRGGQQACNASEHWRYPGDRVAEVGLAIGIRRSRTRKARVDRRATSNQRSTPPAPGVRVAAEGRLFLA